MIEPNNLGSPVYKADQVILDRDLETWQQYFLEIEQELKEIGSIRYVLYTRIIQYLLEDLIIWRNDGKPKLEEWQPKRHN